MNNTRTKLPSGDIQCTSQNISSIFNGGGGTLNTLKYASESCGWFEY